MPIDILGIFKQIKDFIKEEKGTYFSLITFTFLGFFLAQFIYSGLKSAGIIINFLYVFGALFFGIFVSWLASRKISLSKDKTNIGIAHMPVGNIDAQAQLTEEQKLKLSEELVNFIYGSLEHEAQKLNVSKYLHFVKLPHRIVIDYNNNENLPFKLRTEILVWGLLRYNSQKIFYNSKFEFSKSINSELFTKLKHDVQASPELEYNLDEDKNLGIRKFLHIITYIALIFHSLKLMSEDKFEEADVLLENTLNHLGVLYEDESDKSVERGDQDLLAIEALMYYTKGKNLHNWGNDLLQNFDSMNLANEKFIAAGKTLKAEGDLLVKYLNQKHKADSSVIVDHSYIYAISLLAKAGSKEEVDSIVYDLKKLGVHKEKLLFTQALIATKFETPEQAEEIYLKSLQDNPGNTVALRGLGMLYFEKKKYSEAINMLCKLESISTRHIFHSEIYDTSVQLILYKSSLRQFNFFNALFYYLRWKLFSNRNDRIQRNQYIL